MRLERQEEMTVNPMRPTRGESARGARQAGDSVKETGGKTQGLMSSQSAGGGLKPGREQDGDQETEGKEEPRPSAHAPILGNPPPLGN